MKSKHKNKMFIKASTLDMHDLNYKKSMEKAKKKLLNWGGIGETIDILSNKPIKCF